MTQVGDGKDRVDSDFEVLAHYWRIYGGFAAVVKSPYFWMSVLLCALLFPLWVRGGWWDTVLAILPNLLGFSLAGYAIFLAFGNDRFREFLSGTRVKDDSAFLSITTTFMHFVVVQIVALTLALIAKSAYQWPVPDEYPFLILVYASYPFWAAGFLAFCYTLTTSLAALIAIFRLVRLLDLFNKARPSGGAGTTPRK